MNLIENSLLSPIMINDDNLQINLDLSKRNE